MKVQRDLTAERKDALTRIDFSTLPLADAIKDVRGRGSRALAIFSDPDCPHSRRLEAELKGLSDVTIHTFLMPIASLHPQARAKANAPEKCRVEWWASLQADLIRRVSPHLSGSCPVRVARTSPASVVITDWFCYH